MTTARTAAQRSLRRHTDLQAGGATILFVSHSARTVTDLCSRAILLDQGEKIIEGTPKEVMEHYHRLIFAPAEQQPAIRRAIIEGKGAPVPDAAVPESRVAYIPSGGEILDPQLTDSQGRPAPFLTAGESYRFTYRVRFTEALEHLRFSMLVKTKTGLELAGALIQGALASEAGKEVTVEFRFTSPFCAGAYFINCGVVTRGAEGERFVHRILDAVQFQVMPPVNEAEQAVIATAIVDLAAEGRVSAVSALQTPQAG